MKTIILLATLVSIIISVPAYAEIEWDQYEVHGFTIPVFPSSMNGYVCTKKLDGSNDSTNVTLYSSSTDESVAPDVVYALKRLGIKAEIIGGKVFKVEHGKNWWTSHIDCQRR